MLYADLKMLQGVSAVCSLLPDQVLKHEIAELGFPAFDAAFEEFVSAGPAGHAVEVFTGNLEKITVTLKLLGQAPELFKAFLKKGLWTFSGVVVNHDTGEKTPYKVMARGSIGKIAPEARSNKGLHHHDYEFKGVTEIQVIEDGKEIYRWSRKGGVRIHGGQIDAADTAILG
ncbi:MAG: phage major tail tube protein [Cohaesibacter sp.]|nr:phage major tail tube protein [Cohaesibacter sp.]